MTENDVSGKLQRLFIRIRARLNNSDEFELTKDDGIVK